MVFLLSVIKWRAHTNTFNNTDSRAFQGAVESIAMMNAKDRTKMLERISNSQELNEEYDAKLAALQKAKEDTQFHFNKKKAATAEKKQVSKDKTEVLCNRLFLTDQRPYQNFHDSCAHDVFIFYLGGRISGTGGSSQRT